MPLYTCTYDCTIHHSVLDHLKVSMDKKNILKTSVWADQSEHRYENKKVHMFYDQIPQNFLRGIFTVFWIFLG